MHKNLLALFCLCLLAILISCSERLTEKEKQTINRFTLKEEHDSIIIGKWMSPDTLIWKGKTRRTAISFEKLGINNERMFEEGKPFNEWHLNYYYYTKQGKIYFYRPSEKGFLAMDNETFIEYEYKVSADGQLLTIGDKSYTNVNLE
jgi:hypothetical protein